MKRHSDYIMGAVLVLLGVMACCGVQQATAQEEDFNMVVVSKLGEILGSRPTKVTLEYKTQGQMREWYRDELLKDCLRRIPMPREFARSQCLVDNDTLLVFLLGRWIPQDDPGHLYIVLWKHSSTRVVVHEYLHWWFTYQTDPFGILNTHAIVDPAVTDLMTSRAFTKWLEEINE